MNDFPNAAPPPGALYDNAPTWFAGSDTATVTKVPAPAPAAPSHLTPATRIGMVKGGKWIGVEVFMQYGRPIPLDLALKRVAIGRTVFVARGADAERVMEAVGSGVG